MTIEFESHCGNEVGGTVVLSVRHIRLPHYSTVFRGGNECIAFPWKLMSLFATDWEPRWAGLYLHRRHTSAAGFVGLGRPPVAI